MKIEASHCLVEDAEENPGGKLETPDGPPDAGGLERCASRELLEETGIEIAPDRWRAAGTRITPPLFPVRFDARFFLVEAPDGLTLPEVLPSPEIESLDFFRPAEVLERWRAGKALVPPPVVPLLRALREPHDGVDALVGRAAEAGRAAPGGGRVAPGGGRPLPDRSRGGKRG